jgi:iron-sulfur cluster assembly accessory protein
LKKQELITKEMTIDAIFANHPQRAEKLAQILTRFGLHCAGCSAATWETLEAGVYGHGMDEDVLENLVQALNNEVNKELQLDTITLTKKAAEKFKTLCKEDHLEGYGLLFGDMAAGCSGFEYVLDFQKEKGPEDVVLHSEGVDIFIHQSMIKRLIGSEIDYVEGLTNAGFKVSNPNSKAACSCGSSHAYG